MKVERRVSSCSPSLLLLNGSKSAGSAASTNGTTKYYQFQLEPHHVIDNGGKGGQKVFVCDIDGCIFKRSFSLKRHYLRFHINFSFLSPRDINNCAIAIASQQLRSGSTFPIGKKDPIFRCHQCGYLTESKHDLLKHLEIHPTSGITEVNDEVGDTSLSRCPRCSTAFSMRKTLLRHIKKNRCREDVTTLPQSTLVGNGDDPSEDSNSSSSATVWKEEEDVDENSLLDSSCPHFTCTFCLKMFNSYVTLCRHRQLVHSHRHGICSPKLLQQSRKSTGQKSELSSIDFSSYTRNVRENLDGFVVGKRNHIKATLIEDEETPTEFSREEQNSEEKDRWSWGHADGNFLQDVLRMDVPLQQALYRGLKELPESTINQDLESEPSHPETEKLVAALQLRPADQILPNGNESVSIEKPSLSGEWTRRRCYICLPCGKIFQDFLSLLDHQHVSHVSVWCSHIQLEKTLESDVSSELIRQIGRGSLPAESSADLKCTKCQNKVHSLPELHDHILQCSNHTTASPCRRVRSRSKNGGNSSIIPSSNSKNNQWLRGVSGRSKGMQRTHSKNSFVSTPSSQLRCLRQRSNRSSKDDQRTDGSKSGSSNGTPLKNAKRELFFTSKDGKKKKKRKTEPNLDEKRVLRSKTEVTNSKVNVKSLKKEVLKQVSKPKKKKLARALGDPLHECDACHKQFKSQTSVLKHKHYCPNNTVATSSEPEDQDDEDFVPPVSASSSSRKSLPAEINKPASSSSVKSKKKSPPSSEPKSKLNANGTTPSRRGNLAQAEAVKKGTSPKSAKKSIQNATPSKIKTSNEKNLKNKVKEEVDVTPKKSKTPKKASEEEALVTARPIRLSRKTMTPLVMEDQVEAHFNEALSPEQRVQVAEQICPFCIKHYVYKSNFKKHLLEGCNSNGEPERPPSVNNHITVPVDTPKRPVPSSSKKSLSPANVNIVNGHSSKEEKRKKEKIASAVPEKKKKEELQRLNGHSKKAKNAKDGLKKSSKWKEVTAVKKKKTIQAVPKKTGKITNGLKMKKKASIASKQSAVLSKMKVKKTEIASGKETKKKKSSSNWTPSAENKPFNGFSNGISESDTEVLNVEFIVKDLTIPAVGEPDADVAILPFESSNTCTMDTELTEKCNPNVVEKSSIDKLEASSTVIPPEQSVTTDENKLLHSNGLEPTSLISPVDSADDQSTESSTSTLLTVSAKLTRSSTLKEKLRSCHLDGSTLGQAVENAIQNGFLKPYSAITKYPVEVRLLKKHAMDYCQFKEAAPSSAN